jgi:hypothetical protein
MICFHKLSPSPIHIHISICVWNGPNFLHIWIHIWTLRGLHIGPNKEHVDPQLSAENEHHI